MDCGDNVIVINAAKVLLTGDKLKKKTYYRHTGYIGGIKERRAGEILAGNFPSASSKRPSSACCRAGRSAESSCRNLRVYPGAEHPHEAQQPENVDIGAMNPKNTNYRKAKG